MPSEPEEHYTEHDEWVASLKEAAVDVLATHNRTRQALEGLRPLAAASLSESGK